MKIITLHQPWASLVALGLKRYETRHWSTSYRGPLLIHAAKRKIDGDGVKVWLEAQRMADIKPSGHSDPFFTYLKLPLGCIITIADFTACLQMITITGYETPNEIGVPSVSELERSVGLWEPGRFALRLDNVQPLPNPIPFTSRQGKLLDAPPALQLMVHQQLERTA